MALQETLTAAAPTSTPPAQRARAEITALRACAVLLVVLYHLWPGRLPGGYIGVDVFFVISGFLITSHLLRESTTTGRIDLARFWARRARRLLPAAYLVLAATSVAVVAWLPVSSWQQNFRQIIASTLYVQNWVLAADSVDYLASDADPAAAQHYWSLSIEEQFYLVWPLLILAATVWAARRASSPIRATWWAIGVPTVASLLFSLWITQENPPAAYFVTPARAWQFGAGGLLALFLAGRASHVPRRANPTANPALRSLVPTVVSWSGFAVLLWCGLTYDETTPFPGTAAILPVAATVAIIAAAEPLGRFSPAPLMRWRPVGFFGDISYSLYLWHWPPIVILPVVLGHKMGFEARVLVLVGAILAAAATKRWVEDPVRFTSRPVLRRPLTALVATVAGAAVLVAGAWIGRDTAVAVENTQQAVADAVLKDAPECFGAAAMDPENPCSNPELAGTMVPAPAAARRDWPTYPRVLRPASPAPTLADCTFGKVDDPSIPHVVLIGDSHAQVLMTALEQLAEPGQDRRDRPHQGLLLVDSGPDQPLGPDRGSTPARPGGRSSSGGSSQQASDDRPDRHDRVPRVSTAAPRPSRSRACRPCGSRSRTSACRSSRSATTPGTREDDARRASSASTRSVSTPARPRGEGARPLRRLSATAGTVKGSMLLDLTTVLLPATACAPQSSGASPSTATTTSR